MTERASELGHEVRAFQSNHEGAIVDFIQEYGPAADGVIINAGALTQVGYSILDALLDADVKGAIYEGLLERGHRTAKAVQGNTSPPGP